MSWVTTYASAHRLPRLGLAALALAAVGLTIVRLPLPQVAGDIGQPYTEALGFFVQPALLAPALSMALSDTSGYESFASRRLILCRLPLLLVLLLATAMILWPSALLVDIHGAVRASSENSAAIFAVTVIMRTVTTEQWAWIPALALSLAGVMGPETGAVARLLLVNRTPSETDLIAELVLVALSAVLYCRIGPATSAWPRRGSRAGR